MRRLSKRSHQIFKFTIIFAVCLTCVVITGCEKSQQHKPSSVEKVEATCTKEGQKDKCLWCDDVVTCDTIGLIVGTHCLVLQKQEIGHLYDPENGIWIWDGFEETNLHVSYKSDVNHIIDYKKEIKSEPRGPTCFDNAYYFIKDGSIFNRL